MSQHDFDIANQGFAAFRADLNNALKALGSLSSGSAEPATTYANQLWYETDTNTLHIRNEANSAWLDLMVIDQATGSPSFTAGNVGIGDASPDKKLVVYSSSDPDVMVLSHPTATTDTQGATLLFRNESSSGTLSGAEIGYRTGSAIDRGSLIFSTSAASNSPAERMRIDSSGNVLFAGNAVVGVQSSANSMFIGGGGTLPANVTYQTTSNHIWQIGGTERMRIDSSGNVGIGTSSPSAKLHVDGGDSNNIRYSGATNTVAMGMSGANPFIGSITSAPLLFLTGGSERARIDASGSFLVGKTAPNVADAGFEASSLGRVRATVSADSCIVVNRLTDDGNLIQFLQAGTPEGSISVSGTTVSYNGGHLARWAQFPDNSRPDLLKGTVMSNLDQMSNWDGEDNEQLNCVQVSDVEGDANVAGVFVAWDSTDDEYNDILLAMTGDMVIRIAAGTTVQRGDLLMSAGDGTAKPQGDDIVRAKTIAKVTSTHVSHTYEDGSYAVPCVLMAC